MKICYALQVCDLAANQEGLKRYCSDDRTEISRRCILSFLTAANNAAEMGAETKIKIFIDNSSQKLKNFIYFNQYEFPLLNIEVSETPLEECSTMKSISRCWRWLKEQETDLIFLVQDDYLYEEDSIIQMIDIFFKVINETGNHSIISGYHDPYLFDMTYKYKSIPRMVVPGSKQYWIQGYDVSCSFLTSKALMEKHWDLFEKFMSMSSLEPRLEAESVNQMMSKRGELGLFPFTCVSLHMQSELEKDHYIDWETRWNKWKK